MTIAWLVLAAMMVVAGVTLLWPSCLLALVLAALGAAWLSVNNHVFEGPILVTLSEDHGVSSADLVSVLAGALAVLSAARWRAKAAGVDEAARSADDRDDPRDHDATAALCVAAILLIMLVGVGVNVLYQ